MLHWCCVNFKAVCAGEKRNKHHLYPELGLLCFPQKFRVLKEYIRNKNKSILKKRSLWECWPVIFHFSLFPMGCFRCSGDPGHGDKGRHQHRYQHPPVPTAELSRGAKTTDPGGSRTCTFSVSPGLFNACRQRKKAVTTVKPLNTWCLFTIHLPSRSVLVSTAPASRSQVKFSSRLSGWQCINLEMLPEAWQQIHIYMKYKVFLLCKEKCLLAPGATQYGGEN